MPIETTVDFHCETSRGNRVDVDINIQANDPASWTVAAVESRKDSGDVHEANGSDHLAGDLSGGMVGAGRREVAATWSCTKPGRAEGSEEAGEGAEEIREVAAQG